MQLQSQQLRGQDRTSLSRRAPRSQGQSHHAGPTTPQGHHAQRRRLHPQLPLEEPLVRLPAGQPHQPLNLSPFSSNEKLRPTAPFWQAVCRSHHPPLSPPAHFKHRKRQSETCARRMPEAGSRVRSTPPEPSGVLPKPRSHRVANLPARDFGNQDQVILTFSNLKVMLCRCWNRTILTTIASKIRLLLIPVAPLPVRAGMLHPTQVL